jgi:hypothetical protein
MQCNHLLDQSRTRPGEMLTKLAGLLLGIARRNLLEALDPVHAVAQMLGSIFDM